MISAIENEYSEIFYQIRNNHVLLLYVPQERSFYISTESNNVLQRIDFCPWTGKKLPRPLVDEYIELLEASGLSRMEPEKIPISLLSEQWWIDKKL